MQLPTEEVILGLRNPLVELFHALHTSEDYSCVAEKIQLEVFFRGEKVGGLNRQNWRLYISKVFAASCGRPELFKEYGFEWIEEKNGHQYWCLRDVAKHQSFRHVIEEMTGVPIKVKKL